MTPPSSPRLSKDRRIVIAGAQFAVVPNDIPTNLYRCVYFLRRAVDDVGAKLLVFPESITTGFNPALNARDLWELLPRTETMLTPVQQICKELKIHCVLPTYERGSKPGVVYNSAFLIDSRGNNLGAYRKTHLFPPEREALRRAINRWIAEEGPFDAVLDLGAPIADTDDGVGMKKEFALPDGLHPNLAGGRAIAEAIDLSLFA